VTLLERRKKEIPEIGSLLSESDDVRRKVPDKIGNSEPDLSRVKALARFGNCGKKMMELEKGFRDR
jgi:hypothetical protein